MVIVKLYGGLGNQMYQYATAVALAERLDTSVYMDLDWFQEVKNKPELTLRWYELDGFGIDPKTITPFGRLGLTLRPPKVFKEDFFGYLPAFEKLSGNVILDGYWQSYKYFAEHKEAVARAFTFPEAVKPENKKIIDRMESSNSVMLHVRRGDYNTKRGKEFHGLIPLEYYRKAVADLKKKINNPTFYIFSDEIDWCRQNLKLDDPSEFIDSNGPNSGVEDMQLMAGCKHAIIANSSFSWWATWLNTHPGMLVYAPTAWFKGTEHEIEDRLPPEWIRI
jgi:hypothetical protein